jgi:signal transduction histidine kinase
MLDDLGIVAAIENLVHDFAERSDIAVDISMQVGDLALGEPHATALYRMLQEALTNVARHARASRAQVFLEVEDGRLRARVDDDGVGIAPAALEAKGSYGLLGIRERAHTLGGSVRIGARQEGGTTVEIVLPLQRRDG